MMFAASLIHVVFVLENSAPDSEAFSEMNDLGTLMLGGFVLAVVAAIAFTIVRLKIREKKPEGARFISINSRDDE